MCLISLTSNNTIPILLIQRSSSNEFQDNETWKSMSSFKEIEVQIKNKPASEGSRITITRIQLPYMGDYYPIGGLQLIRLKLYRYEYLMKRKPAFIVANSINQEMTILATEMKIPLIGCSKEFGVPDGLGMDQPIWISPPPIMEYYSLQRFIEKRGYGGCVVLLIEPRLVSAIVSHLSDELADSLVIEFSNNKKSELHHKLRTKKRSNRIYICIPFVKEHTILESIKLIQDYRKSSIIVLMPHVIYEKIQQNVYVNLKKHLRNIESFVSATMDHSYHYKFTNWVGDDCFSRSIQLIIEALNIEHYQNNKSLCINYLDAPVRCLTNVTFYKRKRKVLKDYVKNEKNGSRTKFSLRYTYGFYSYKEIAAYPKLSYYRQKPIAAMTDKSMLVKTAHLRTISFLQSPYVMVRNLSTNDNCNDDGYGLECSVISMAVENSSKISDKIKMCCFGLSIDVLAIISRLERYSKEFKVAKSSNDDLLITNYELDIQVYNRVDPNNGKGIFLAQAQLNNQLFDKLMDFSADLTLGSHIVVSKSNHNVSYLTKPYLSASIALMISRKGNLARHSAITGFLDPFAWSMWLGIFLTIQIAAIASVIYEWHSPYGLTPRGRNRNRIFSFSSALTLCWSILFSHNVATKSPKCWSSRFLINVYACFCVIFLASYTANLAAYMVGEKSLREITGFHDKQISYGNIRLGTILGSGTEFYLRKAQPNYYKFIRLFINPEDAINALRNGVIDAFVYDIEALQFYKRTHFIDKFEIVGKPFAQVSYAIALSKNLENFGEDLSNFLSRVISADGFQKFMDLRVKLWTREMTGVDKISLLSSDSMETRNFTGPLLLFCAGILLGFLTLLLEYIVFYFVLPILRKYPKKECYLSISQRLFRHLNSDNQYSKSAYSVRHYKNSEMTLVKRLHNHRRLSDDRWINELYLLKYFVNERLDKNNASHSELAESPPNIGVCNCSTCKPQNVNLSWIQYLHQLNKHPEFMSVELSISDKSDKNNNLSSSFNEMPFIPHRKNASTQTTAYKDEESVKIIAELTEKIWQLSTKQRSLSFLLAHYKNQNFMNLKFSEI